MNFAGNTRHRKICHITAKYDQIALDYFSWDDISNDVLGFDKSYVHSTE